MACFPCILNKTPQIHLALDSEHYAANFTPNATSTLFLMPAYHCPFKINYSLFFTSNYFKICS